MEIKKGIAVSPGIVISTAVVLDAEDLAIPERHISAEQIPAELERFSASLAASIKQVQELRTGVTATAGKEIAGIFDAHIGILRDKTLLTQVEAEIRKQKTTAEFAVSVVMRRYADLFHKMSDRYLSERVKDIHDIERRIIGNLIGQQHYDLAHLSDDVVVIAHDLLPSQTAALDRRFVRGFATDVGGRTSHTAIVARAMGLPAVVGLGNITGEVNTGDAVIIDGNHGVVIINPDAEQIADYLETTRRRVGIDEALARLKDLPARTLDNHEVTLMANIEVPAGADEALDKGAQGVGLYRTEFLYLTRDTEPSEEEHYEAYLDAIHRLKGRPLVIRTEFPPLARLG